MVKKIEVNNEESERINTKIVGGNKIYSDSFIPSASDKSSQDIEIRVSQKSSKDVKTDIVAGDHITSSDITQIQQLLKEFQGLVQLNLSQDDKNELQEVIQEIEYEIEQPTPRKSKLIRLTKSLRDFVVLGKAANEAGEQVQQIWIRLQHLLNLIDIPNLSLPDL